MNQRETLAVGDQTLAQAARMHVLHGLRRTRLAGRPLQAGMKEISDFFAVLVERAEEAGVKFVVFLQELLEDGVPNLVGMQLRVLFAGRGGHALFREYIVVDLAHVFGRLARLARHRRPHLEFLDRLVEGQVHDELLRMLRRTRSPPTDASSVP